jgi:hypothetical protein
MKFHRILTERGLNPEDISTLAYDEIDAFRTNQFTRNLFKFLLEKPYSKVKDAVNYITEKND